MEQRAWQWMKVFCEGLKRFFWWQPTTTLIAGAETRNTALRSGQKG